MNLRRMQFIGSLCALVCATIITQADYPRTAVVAWGQQVIPLVDKDTRFKAVAAGAAHNLAITTSGTVIAWGRNMGAPSWDLDSCEVPPGLNDAVAVAAGGSHSVVLRADGTVIAWAQGSYNDVTTRVPAGLSNVVQIAAGENHTLALKSDGKVVSWGGGMSIPPGVTNITAIAAGNRKSIALKADGTVLRWERGMNGALVVASNIVAVTQSYGLKSDGTVVAYVLPSPGGLEPFTPIANPPTGLSNVVALAEGLDVEYNVSPIIALKSDGTLVSWTTGAPQFPGSLPHVPIPAGLSHVSAIAVGQEHGLFLKTDGTLVASGNSSYAQGMLPWDFQDVVDFVPGLALKRDGRVMTWGSNGAGMVTGLSNVIAVAADLDNRMALKSDGRIVVLEGEIPGQSSVINSLTNAVAIAVGYDHALALDAFGAVWMWGSNAHGELNLPAGLTNVVAIAAGGWRSVALKADGTAIAWGWYVDEMNQILTNYTDLIAIDNTIALRANGTTVNFGSSSGLPVSSNVIAVASTQSGHQMALLRDRTVIAGTYNDRGQSDVPSGLRPAIAVRAGADTSYAIVLIEPAIRTRVVGSNLVLSWPVSVGAYVLQSSANFSDADSWSEVEGDLVVVNDLNTMTLPVGGGQRFFRLVQVED